MAAFEPFHDSARTILESESALNDDQRADLWDKWHAHASADSLDRELTQLPISDSLRTRLVEAKLGQQTPDAMRPVALALAKLQHLPPKVLDVAEAHPTLLRHFVDAAVKEQ